MFLYLSIKSQSNATSNTVLLFLHTVNRQHKIFYRVHPQTRNIYRALRLNCAHVSQTQESNTKGEMKLETSQDEREILVFVR